MAPARHYFQPVECYSQTRKAKPCLLNDAVPRSAVSLAQTLLSYIQKRDGCILSVPCFIPVLQPTSPVRSAMSRLVFIRLKIMRNIKYTHKGYCNIVAMFLRYKFSDQSPNIDSNQKFENFYEVVVTLLQQY